MYAKILKADILSILRKKPKPKKLVGWQEVPMDLDALRSSLVAAAQSKG